MLQLTVVALNDEFVNVQVDGDTTIDTLKAILEAETQIPSMQQALAANNRLLQDAETVQGAGLKDGDVIQMLPATAAAQGGQAPPAGQHRPAAAAPGPGAALGMNPDGSARDPASFIAAIRQDAASLANLSVNLPEVARAVREGNHTLLQDQLRMMHKRKLEHEAAMAREMELLEADPMDLDAQKRIEDLIRQKNVDENYTSAMEHSPEVFAAVHMLYIDMEVNGTPVKAFVDSGAQMTIMTHEFAEKCGLVRLMDTRFQGMAVGVGSSKILGKVHQAQAKVGGQFLTVAVTILEQKSGPPFILGLDQLKKHACCINLRTNKLEFSSADVAVPFLSEAEVPQEHSFGRNADAADASGSTAGA